METEFNYDDLKNARLTKEDLNRIGGFEILTEDEKEFFLNSMFIYANLLLELYEE